MVQDYQLLDAASNVIAYAGWILFRAREGDIFCRYCDEELARAAVEQVQKRNPLVFFPRCVRDRLHI